MTNKPYRGTQAVIRAIALLKAFTDENPEWRLTDLSREVGLNKTTTFRLLTALESEELLARDQNSDIYRLGPEIVVMGGRALRSNDLRSASRPNLESIAEETQETATLEVLTGAETLIIDEISGKHAMSGTQSIGTRWPAYATSTGKAILANLPVEKVEALLTDPLIAHAPNTITSLDDLLVELAHIRRQGYAVANEELELGLIAIAAPVRNFDNDVVAAISVSGPSPRMLPESISTIGEMVCSAADCISLRLGFQPREED